MRGGEPRAGHVRPEGRRPVRVGRRIQEEISDMILRGLKDPRLDMVSITDVEVTGDLQAAKVYFCVFEKSGKRAEAAAEGFASAQGFIRRELLKRLDLRRIPELTFHFDPSFDYGDRIERLLKETRPDDETAKSPEEGEAGKGPAAGEGGAEMRRPR